MKSLFLLVLGGVFSLLSCNLFSKPAPESLPSEYHLDIAYGSITNYTGRDGQWLNIYSADRTEPTPVYIWAHGNGHTYRDAHQKYQAFVEALRTNGISVVSWESYKQMDETNYTAIMDDAETMFQWLKDNASSYNLDMSRVIIGGHSRGTIASWGIAQSQDPGILGIYYGDAAGNLDDVNAQNDLITASSPPIRMAYTQNFATNDGQHDPNEGQKIIDLYRGQGFAEEDSRILIDQGYPSMSALGFYSDLLSFCQYVLSN